MKSTLESAGEVYPATEILTKSMIFFCIISDHNLKRLKLIFGTIEGRIVNEVNPKWIIWTDVCS